MIYFQGKRSKTEMEGPSNSNKQVFSSSLATWHLLRALTVDLFLTVMQRPVENIRYQFQFGNFHSSFIRNILKLYYNRFIFSQDNLLNVASSKFGHLQKMGPQCVSPMEMGTEQYQNSFTNRKQPINRQGNNQEQLGACAVPYRRVRSISGTSEYSDSDGKVRVF